MAIYNANAIKVNAAVFCRPLSAELGALPDLDLPGRVVLHGEHNASVHHIGRSLSLTALPHAIRSQQDASTGHP